MLFAILLLAGIVYYQGEVIVQQRIVIERLAMPLR